MELDKDIIKTHMESRQSLLFFLIEVLGYKRNDAFGYKDLVKPHMEMVEVLEQEYPRKILLTPRYTLKSSINTVGYALWKLIKNPDYRVLIYSDSATKAQGFLQGIKNHIKGRSPNSRFRELFGNWETDPHNGKWNESQINIKTREFNYIEPSVDTSGIESSKVGMHYDLIIFDDIVSDINCTTKAQMEKVFDCYKKSLSLLVPKGEIIITGTRWHYGDAYGRILKDNEDKQNFKEFIRDAEEKSENGRPIYEGIGLDRKFLDYQRKEQGSYIFSCLYRNSPVSDETALFKIENFRYYEPHRDFHKNLFITGTCDPAGEGDDFTAIVVIGTDNNNNMYVLDAVNDHLKPSQIISKVINLNYKWEFQRFGVEKNFYKGMLERELREAIARESVNKTFIPFGVDEIISSVKQKNFARVLSLQPMHERGQIYLPGKDFNALVRVYSELAFQMIQFTIDGSKSPHDDLLTALALQTDIFKRGGSPEQQGPPETSAAWWELQCLETIGRSKKRIRGEFPMVFNK